MERLLSELATLAAGHPTLDWVGPLLRHLPYQAPVPRHLPVCDLIEALPHPPETAPVVTALQDVIPACNWLQSYTQVDGFSQDWLDAYGWINVASPDGPFISPNTRVAIVYFGVGQHYPPHAHQPEETYVVLAGSARFQAAGRAPITATPGQLIHHAPWQPHAMTMTDQPLLAAAYWRGAGLMDRSRLDVSLEVTS